MGFRLVASRPFDRAVAVAASGATGKAREKTLVKAPIRWRNNWNTTHIYLTYPR